MKNLGFHLGSDTTLLINPNTDIVIDNWNKIVLMADGKEIIRTSTKTNSYGSYVSDGILYIDGEPIAKDTSSINLGLHKKGNDVYFGKVKLNLGEDEVINITKEDYSTLLSGDIADGYTVFRPDAVYNIVDSLPGPTITFNKEAFCSKFGLKKLQYALYNNIVGLSKENTFTDKHFKSTDTPSLSVHDYDFRITKGDKLKFMVMVDTKYLDKLVNKTIYNKTNGNAHTFTIIVKDKFGSILFKRTVYAGEIYVELLPFIHNNTLFSGETWFSVECINEEGCGSAVRYYDLLIRESNEEVTYIVSLSKLSDPTIVGTHKELVNGQELNVPNTITPNNSNEKVAYYNKVGFTNLFKYYANLTYNGKPITKLVIPKNVYYINYHKLIDSSSNATHPFGEYKFSIYTLNSYTALKVADISGRVVKRGVNYNPNDPSTYDVVDDPLEYVRQDKYRLYRVTTSDVNKYKTDGIFTFNGDPKRTLTDDDIGKIWVRWRNKFIYDDVNSNGQTIWEVTGENQEDELHLRYLNAYDPDTEVYVGDTDKKFLRTYNINNLPKNTKTGEYISGTYYVVERTSAYGDNLEFPDNITIDFNGSTLKAIHCQDSSGNDLHYFDLSTGHIIYLEENYNTHIKNLKVEGLFYELDWIRTALITGRGNGGVCEAVNNISTAGSRFCSYENVESVYSVCYDCNNLARTASKRTSSSNIIPSGVNGMFAQLGYIDFNGNIINYTTPIRKVAGFNNKYSENLVYDETYRSCNVTQWYARRKNSNGTAASFRADDFAICGSNPNANGKHYEMFVAFYSIPNNNISNAVFKGIIKTRQLYRIKCPEGATHFRVVGYGLSELKNSKRVSAMMWSDKYVHEFVSSDGKTHYTNAAFPGIDLDDWTFSEHSKGILYKNCYWHDSRSTTFSVETAKGVTFDGCTSERIAYLSYGDWSITKILSAFEDGGYKTSMVTIKNCTFKHTRPDYSLGGMHSPANKLRYDEVNLLPLRCRDFTLVNNVGLIIGTSSAVYDGYIADNIFEEYSTRRGQPIAYRHMVYRNNNIFRRLVKNYYTPGTYYDPDTIDNDIDDDDSNDNENDIVIDTSTLYRTYNCDDAPSYKIVMQGYFVHEEANGQMPAGSVGYDFEYRRSKVGNKTYK